MTKYILMSLAAVTLLGQGCAFPTDGGTSPTSTGKTPVVVTGRVETPQVYFVNKLAFSARELTGIRENVIDPLVVYYNETGLAAVVSIMITRTSTGIKVDAIVDQFEDAEPVYHGFIHPRSGADTYPRWYPEEVPPGYKG